MEWLSEEQSLVILAELIQKQTGLQFDHSRIALLADKLAPLLAEGHFESVMDYYYYLKYDDDTQEEWRRVQSALAVNETYFWREANQLESAAQLIVSDMQKKRWGRPVRIWHAACATGEEPYSMAMFLDRKGAFQQGPVEIIATDFNETALNHAKKGLYRPRSFRQIPSEITAQYFSPDGNGLLRINDSIRSRVKFSYLNLVDQPVMNQMGEFDVIFCRNVFIYFTTSAIQQVIDNFYRALAPEGYLFIAAAESLLRWANLFQLVEIGSAFAYKKTGAQGDKA